MPEEEVDALIERFAKDFGGRRTYLVEDENGIFYCKGKRYSESKTPTNLEAIVFAEPTGGITRDGDIFVIKK